MMDIPLPLVVIAVLAAGHIGYTAGWLRGWLKGYEKARDVFVDLSED
jgi:hypothetical protein